MNTDRLNAENFIPPKWQKTWWGALAFVAAAGLVAYLLAILFFGTG
jgi:dolichol kinase